MTRIEPYPSDLTDAQWDLLEPLIPAAIPYGRRRTVDMREIWNALFYLTRTGCQWRALPRDFPKWSTVYHYHRRFLDDGTWEAANDRLRQMVRAEAGRAEEPTAAVIDSQSVKTTEKGGGAAMTPARRSTGASATFWSIRWVS